MSDDPDPRLGVTQGYTTIVAGRSEIYVHRLVAYAHGEIDHLWERRDIHHVDGCEWRNSPENLRRVMPGDHRGWNLPGRAEP